MILTVAKWQYSDLPPPEPEPEAEPFLLDAGDPLAEPDPDLEPDRDLAVPESDPLGDRDIDFDCDLGEISCILTQVVGWLTHSCYLFCFANISKNLCAIKRLF